MNFNAGPNVGDLNRRIVLRRATQSRDGFNSPVLTFSNLTTVWAKADPVSDGERMRAGQEYSTLAMRFQIRWSSVVANLDTKDQLIHDGRTYNIVGVKEIERHRWLEITAATAGERA